MHLCIDLVPQVLALVSSVMGKKSVCSESHSHTDHFMRYSLVQCPPEHFEELGTPVFYILWP